MYLHKLEKDEKTEFISLARHLAKIDDDKIDDREAYMLQYMCAEMGLTTDLDGVEPFDLERLVTVFFREEARRIVMIEAIGICASGGSIDASQKELLTELAGRFRLGEKFMTQAENAIRKQVELMDDFDRLIEEG